MPDPSTYNPRDNYTKTMGAAIGFGTGQRESLEGRKGKERDPGPGQYELPPKAFESKYKFHMGVKLKDQGKDNYPGPADYEQHREKL